MIKEQISSLQELKDTIFSLPRQDGYAQKGSVPSTVWYTSVWDAVSGTVMYFLHWKQP